MAVASNQVEQDFYHGAFELAVVFHGLWQFGDVAFRSLIEQTMRAYVQRHPSFTSMLKKAAQSYTPIRVEQPAIRDQATQLYALWQLADVPLRADAEKLIRTYSQNHPNSIVIFRTLLTEHEQLLRRRVRQLP